MAGTCLTLGKRKEIERLYAADTKPSEIAAAVGVTTATIYRELRRGETGELNEHYRPAYCAEVAERAVKSSIRNRGRRKAAQ
jgi:IS30 family transposase